MTPLREKQPDAPDLPRCYLPPLHTYRRNWLERLIDWIHDWKAR